MSHTARIQSFSGAGQRNHRAACDTCLWVGRTTSDKETARDEMRAHHRENGDPA